MDGVTGDRFRRGTAPEAGSGELWHEVVGCGLPLVVIPGGPGLAHDYLRPHLDPLAEAATVVWLDLPGAGRSEISGGVESITHGRWIESLEALRDQLGFRRWTVLGHSYGGFVAVEYALLHPGSVAGLVLCAAAPSPAHLATLLDRVPPELSAADRTLLLALLTDQVADDELESRIREAASFFLCADPPDSTLDSFRLQPATFRHVLGPCLPGVAIEGRLGEVDVPTLVVAGGDDWQSPLEVTDRLVAAIPGAELAVIPRAGHYPFIDDPMGVVGAVRSWLERRGLS
jgi:proline iminopeptidase